MTLKHGLPSARVQCWYRVSSCPGAPALRPKPHRTFLLFPPLAAKLLEAVLQQCRGHVNSSVGPFLRMVYARLQKPFQQASFQDSLMLVVFNALYYDPALTLRELEGMGALGPVFTMAAAMVRARKSKRPNRPQHFRDEYSKKVVCLGLTGGSADGRVLGPGVGRA